MHGRNPTSIDRQTLSGCLGAYDAVVIESLNAVTFETADMGPSVRFYVALGFQLRYGGEDATFSSFRFGDDQHFNLELQRGFTQSGVWGRVIFYVTDVDALYRHLLDLGLKPSTAPRDASWGERFFHISDPDGHELSFAKLLR
jgi:catechol 2,3-dioxygenase-like lactoylglutathione lyase family enzyme